MHVKQVLVSEKLTLKGVLDICRRVHYVDMVRSAKAHNLNATSGVPMFPVPRELKEWRQKSADTLSEHDTEILSTTGLLRHYGHEFGHCLGNYVTSADKPEWFIRRGSAIAQVAFTEGRDGFCVRQCHGPQNQSTAEAQLLKQELHTFFANMTSEQRDRTARDVKLITKSQTKRLEKIRQKTGAAIDIRSSVAIIQDDEILHMLPIPGMWPVSAPAATAPPPPRPQVPCGSQPAWRAAVREGTTNLGFKEWTLQQDAEIGA
jgi:hypothetical protein